MKDFTGGSNGSGTPPHGNGGLPGGGIPLGNSQPLGGDDIDATEFLINYNEKFKNTDPCMFRDSLIDSTLGVLIGKNKPNALLIGAAGVGKTKIVESIAHKLANDDDTIPDTLKGCTIYELPLSNIVAGSSFVGQLEEKCKAVIEFVTDKKNKAILFIDEIHTIVGESQTYEKIAQILKPALARGDISVIGATTLQEAGNLSEDPAFARRFSRIIVDELSREQTVEILKSLKTSFFKHYNNKITISDDILETVCFIADQYRPAGSHRPDNAITLLDRTIGDTIIMRKKQEKEAQNNPILKTALQNMPLIPIRESQLRATAHHLMTGHNKKNDLDVKKLTNELSKIKGQDNILPALIEQIKRNDTPLFPKNKPLTILFAGSSGVGKTEVTKIIAQELTGSKPITLNMTEYNSPASINRIIGSPAGYVGSDSHAELPFDCLESNPYQVILLDELEKADKAVQRLFMQAFDEGEIKTAKGKTIDFSKAIIFATTNAGHTETAKTLGFVSSEKTTDTNETVSTLSNYFDTEFLNRFEKIYTFNNLSKETYAEIVKEQYITEVARITKETRRIKLLPDIPDDELEKIVNDTYVPSFGARPAQRAVREYIQSQI